MINEHPAPLDKDSTDRLAGMDIAIESFKKLSPETSEEDLHTIRKWAEIVGSKSDVKPVHFLWHVLSELHDRIEQTKVEITPQWVVEKTTEIAKALIEDDEPIVESPDSV